MLPAVPAIKILYVTPEYTAEERTLENTDLAGFQALVGGYIEAIYSDSFLAFVNADGRIDGLPPNAVASVLAYRFGWPRARTEPLVGSVVFLGPGATAGGDVKPVRDELVQEAMATAQRMRQT